jgi:PAS domain S-box-containing protein
LRTFQTILGLIAFALLVALGVAVFHDLLALAELATFVILVAVAFSFLLREAVQTRQRIELLERQVAHFKSTSARLEQSATAASAANARLIQSEARYRGFVDAQGDAVLRRAPDGRLNYGNEAFYRLFGLNSQRALGQPFAPELHPTSSTPLFGNFAGLETGRGRVRYDQHIRTAYGWRWIAWEDYAVRDAHGGLIEVQSVGRDITERKALEDAIAEARDKAEAGSRAKSGFLATMSHEIRTPMNGVLGMARLLRETDLRPEQRTYVDAISQSGESLLTLIGEILDFSKIESGNFVPDEDEVGLRPLIEGVVELACPRAHDKDIEVVATVAPEVPEVLRADGVRLRQVLTNLVGNAVKFTQRGGVEVQVRREERHDRPFIRFEVRDTGLGVPADKREEIFREFVQAAPSHARKFGGSGLGLAISKKLVEAMGGEIGIDEAQGGGSRFWFTIPATVLKPAPEVQTAPLARFHVGIVTRNAVLREGLAAQIRAAGGTPMDMVEGRGTRPDVLLVDAGSDAEPNLAALPEAGTRALVLVTPGARSQLAAMREMGFAGYLVKPVREATLIQRLRELHVEPEATTPTAGLTQAGPRFDHSLRILLVEDNAINALLTRETLRRRGHRVVEVTTGEAALGAMETGGFDIILTDIHLPGMNGIEATRAIRELETATGVRRTPIVALTADALETGRRACKDAGMDGFLTKPIEPAQLDDMFNIFFPSAEPRCPEAA